MIGLWHPVGGGRIFPFMRYINQRAQRGTILGLVMGCFLCGSVGGSDLRSRLDQVGPDHPRLFLGPGGEEALSQKLESTPLLQKAYKHVEATADEILDLPLIERKKVGRRMLGTSRLCLQRVFYLSLAYRMTDDERYGERAIEEMLEAAAFSDWNPRHFLDVAEMTAALAIGYDWVHDVLEPGEGEVIRRAIIEKGLKPSMAGGWWVDAENNWNPVCHGGLVLGALAILEDEPELAEKVIQRAIENVPRAMAEYAPDGAYPEGPGYWNYGTTYNVILIDALESVLGTDFGLSKAEGFMDTGDYYLHATGPTGLYFNYSDSRPAGGVSPTMFWFAAKRSDSSLLWREIEALEDFLSRPRSAKGISSRSFPFLILWAKAFDRIPAPQVTNWRGGGKTPVAFHRTGWKGKDEIFVAVKGGSPRVSHAHMDIGTFVMDAAGVRWAEDLGLQPYYDLESKGISLWSSHQEGQRWDVFRLNNFSHNTLVVNGRKQQADGHAPISDFSGQGESPYTVIDMSAVYDGQLDSAKRKVSLVRERSVLIVDEIKTLDRESTVRWGMVTRASVEVIGDGEAILRKDGKELALRVKAQEGVQLQVFETEDPPNDYDAPNPGTRMIGFKVVCEPASEVRLAVELAPDGF